MRTRKCSLTLILVLMFGPCLGASFGRTAPNITNISGLKLGHDKGVSEEADSFEPGDTIYAAARISDVAGAVNVTAHLVVDDVPGQQRGPIPGLEATVNMAASGTANFNFSAPTKGWPKGKYVVVVVVHSPDGEEIDKKAAELTVD
ncbi:MAG TPA: hypothetical protein VLZ81_14235 [Blastocatellia bacterium]|nr:hypothetical protein [Blastocatellia bacterium]